MVPSRRAVTLRPPPKPLGSGLISLSACDETVGMEGCHQPAPLGHLALLLTHEGSADSQSGDVRFTHRPRRLVAVAEGVRYEESMPEGELWHLSYLLLRGPWCDDLNHLLRERPGSMLVVDAAAPALRVALCETVELVLTQPTAWVWQAQATLSSVIGDLLTLAAEADAPLSARIGRLIDREPARVWSLPALANHLDLTVASLVRHFRAEAGESPAAWMRRRRIEHAQRLITQGLDVGEASERLGFANPYHFSRVFKSVTGIPPSHVRRAETGTPLHR
jgi:AraC family transcriptional regulator, arabinose operon regulatory protein